MCLNCELPPEGPYPTAAVELAKDPSSTPEQLTALVERYDYTPWGYERDSYDPTVRKFVAANPNAGDALLAKLSHDKDGAVRGAVIANPATPDEVISRMFVEGRGSAHAVAEARFKPSYFVSLIHENPSYGDRWWVLSRALSRATADDLERFVGSENADVREGVVITDRATPEQLRRLSADATIKVRAAVAASPHTPADVIEALTTDSSPKVRRAAGENTGISIETVLATEVKRFRRLATPKAGKAVISREAEVRGWVRTTYPEFAAFESKVTLTALMEFVSAEPRGFTV